MKTDTGITPADVRDKHLLLFGGPAGKFLVAKNSGGLPVQTEGSSLKIGDDSFDDQNTLLSYILPNPECHRRYVYVESGTSPLAYWAEILPERDADLTVQTVDVNGSDLLFSGSFEGSWRTVEG